MKKKNNILYLIDLVYLFCIAFIGMLFSQAAVTVLLISDQNLKTVVVCVVIWLATGIAIKALVHTIDTIVENNKKKE